jgi:predicted murein hydrolase (TIGR00659 family)
MEIIANSLLYVTMTFVVYCLAKYLQDRTHSVLLNPLLITMAVLIVFLKFNHIDYSTYQEGGQFIDFWLKPAIVALGLPLYRQLTAIRRQLGIILAAQVVGCVVGIISVVYIARLLGAGEEVVLSLAPKSVTTPIAMEVTKAIGGIPPLTAAIVICVGVFGSMIGFKLMKLCGITNPISQGLAIGTAAHAIGTSEATKISERYGAYSGLGIIFNGTLTAIITPVIMPYL